AARLLLDLDALVMVVDGDSQLPLRSLLPDHVLIEELLDLRRRGERRADATVLEPVVVGDDVVAHLHALVTDEDGRTRNELANVVLILVTERATKNVSLAVLLDHGVCWLRARGV